MSYYSTFSELSLENAGQQAKVSKEIRTEYTLLSEVPDSQKREDYLIYIRSVDTYYRWDPVGMAHVIAINPASGTIISASNVGTAGVGVFLQELANNLEFKKINALNNKVSITDDVGNSEVDIGINEANIVHQNLSGAGSNTHTNIDGHIAGTSLKHPASVVTTVAGGNTYATTLTAQGDINALDAGIGTAIGTALLKANNLSDVSSVGASRTNLKLGDATAITDGELLIGNTGTNVFDKASLSATANQTTVTPSAGGLAVGTVQDVAAVSAPIFANITSSNAASSANHCLRKTEFETHSTSTSNPHSVTKTQVGLSNVENLKVNLTAIVDPGSGDDSLTGYAIGSRWINTVTDKEFVCLDVTIASAVWKETTQQDTDTGEVNTASNVGAGATVFKQKTVFDLEMKSITATSSKIAIANNTDDVGIDVTEANLSLNNIGGTLGVTKAGTGITSYVTGDLIVASGVSTLAKLPDVTTGSVLKSAGVGFSPAYGKVALNSDVSSILPASNGGTGINTYVIGDLLVATGATTLSKFPSPALGNVLKAGGVGVSPFYAKVGLVTDVSGALGVVNGGTETTTVPNTGQLLIGNGTTYDVSNLATFSTNRISIANGVGTITLSSPQDTHTTAANFQTAGQTISGSTNALLLNHADAELNMTGVDAVVNVSGARSLMKGGGLDRNKLENATVQVLQYGGSLDPVSTSVSSLGSMTVSLKTGATTFIFDLQVAVSDHGIPRNCLRSNKNHPQRTHVIAKMTGSAWAGEFANLFAIGFATKQFIEESEDHFSSAIKSIQVEWETGSSKKRKGINARFADTVTDQTQVEFHYTGAGHLGTRTGPNTTTAIFSQNDYYVFYLDQTTSPFQFAIEWFKEGTPPTLESTGTISHPDGNSSILDVFSNCDIIPYFVPAKRGDDFEFAIISEREEHSISFPSPSDSMNYFF